ncbi:MAG: type II toxin-antitoxin system VapC family toxin [Dissulfurimicrobium sp.]|uniref:type II toxin-antitoxin system VapC family toxin n=1 Tax=Dissulfurimicrobium TaxID=1769732 RepID=UPI003C741A08
MADITAYIKSLGGKIHHAEQPTPVKKRKIVAAELCAGVKGNTELTVLENFISLSRVVPITGEIAKIGGLFKRDFGKSHGVGLANAVLAATAYAEKAELKILNVKHCPMFNGLEPPYRQ